MEVVDSWVMGVRMEGSRHCSMGIGYWLQDIVVLAAVALAAMEHSNSVKKIESILDFFLFNHFKFISYNMFEYSPMFRVGVAGRMREGLEARVNSVKNIESNLDFFLFTLFKFTSYNMFQYIPMLRVNQCQEFAVDSTYFAESVEEVLPK